MKDLARRHADMLTKGEVVQLFRMLEEKRSLSEVCRIVGIDRKTVYNWEKVREIKRETKKKILEAALTLKPSETAEFLADMALEKAVGIIARLLIYLYERAMKSTTTKEFEKWYREFTRIAKKYDKPVLEPVRGEVERLHMLLKRKAIEKGVEIAVDVSGFSPTYIGDLKQKMEQASGLEQGFRLIEERIYAA